MKWSHVCLWVVRLLDEKSDSQVHVWTQWWTEEAGLGIRVSIWVILSQKHPLQAVSGHAALVFRLCVALGVGAAGGGALWRAQVVHEGQPVLPTEVHKLNLAHAWVKVDAWREVESEKSSQVQVVGWRSVLCCAYIHQHYWTLFIHPNVALNSDVSQTTETHRKQERARQEQDKSSQ